MPKHSSQQLLSQLRDIFNAANSPPTATKAIEQFRNICGITNLSTKDIEVQEQLALSADDSGIIVRKGEYGSIFHAHSFAQDDPHPDFVIKLMPVQVDDPSPTLSLFREIIYFKMHEFCFKDCEFLLKPFGIHTVFSRTDFDGRFRGTSVNLKPLKTWNMFFAFKMELLATTVAAIMPLLKDHPHKLNIIRWITYAWLKACSDLHKAGVLHRDVKPDNIAIDKDGVPRLSMTGPALPATTYNKWSHPVLRRKKNSIKDKVEEHYYGKVDLYSGCMTTLTLWLGPEDGQIRWDDHEKTFQEAIADLGDDDATGLADLFQHLLVEIDNVDFTADQALQLPFFADDSLLRDGQAALKELVQVVERSRLVAKRSLLFKKVLHGKYGYLAWQSSLTPRLTSPTPQELLQKYPPATPPRKFPSKTCKELLNCAVHPGSLFKLGKEELRKLQDSCEMLRKKHKSKHSKSQVLTRFLQLRVAKPNDKAAFTVMPSKRKRNLTRRGDQNQRRAQAKEIKLQVGEGLGVLRYLRRGKSFVFWKQRHLSDQTKLKLDEIGLSARAYRRIRYMCRTEGVQLPFQASTLLDHDDLPDDDDCSSEGASF